MKTLPHANLKRKKKKGGGGGGIIADNYYQHKYLTWVKFTELHVQTTGDKNMNCTCVHFNNQNHQASHSAVETLLI